MSERFLDDAFEERFKAACTVLGGIPKAANHLGTYKNKLYRITKRELEPGATLLKRLAELSGYSLDWIITGNGEKIASEHESIRPNIKNKKLLNDIAEIVSAYLEAKSIHISFHALLEIILISYEKEMKDSLKSKDTPQANKNKINDFIDYYMLMNPKMSQ